MKKYILIWSDGIGIAVQEFASFEAAQNRMQKEYDSYITHAKDDDTYYIEEGSAFIRTDGNTNRWGITSVQFDELRIPLDKDTDIVANLCPVEEYPAVQCYLESYSEKKNGVIWQDIALIRPNEEDSQKVDVLVWGDGDDEDYTNRYVISQYRQEWDE